MPNIDNSIAIAKNFTSKWEQLASVSPNKVIYFSSPSSLDGNTMVYAYPDADSYSIGWGTYDTLSDGTIVISGLSITKDQSDYELDYELRQKESEIRGMVTADLTDTQYAALIDLAYNAGSGALKYNGLLDAINNGGDVASILPTIAITEKGTGKVLNVLKNRRKDEAMLWSGNYNDLYSYYLRNENTILIATGIAAIGLSISLYLYFKYKKK